MFDWLLAFLPDRWLHHPHRVADAQSGDGIILAS
jgi:hypothetical protein